MFLDSTPRVLSIQSHVVHGYVGNKSAVFPLQLLGFEVDAINTVQFSTHGAYPHRHKGTILKIEEMDTIFEGLQLNGVDYYTHFLTGYSMSPDSLKKITQIIKKLREKNPNLIYVCDPVMGDNGEMYVPEAILPIYRDIVIPLADIITPNQFEAQWITGLEMKDLAGALKVIDALHNKGAKTVVLSSTILGDEKSMISIASNKASCYQILIPKIDATFIGTGDLFASLFLAWSYKTKNNLKLTLEKTIATLQHIVRDTYEKARAIQPTGIMSPALLELKLIPNKATIEDPQIIIKCKEVRL
ncbi:pyridoxal kinase [Melitaea cinxia]|uniref:pyridoxal kinase n=1 Tax=Melitaea cinxia TaxID=113334 RepID=UPI001E270384|nr:pyridoxal kinase [Melitaea cinxia]